MFSLFFQSESHHSSYSPQPQPFPQNNMCQTQPQTKLNPQPAAANPHQVQRPLFNFPHSPPTHFSPLHNLGLLPLPPQIPIPNNSWPIHGQIIRSSGNPPHSGGIAYPTRSGSGSSSTTNPSAVNLNDPSIIFAGPAARSVGVPNSSHDGHWHNSQPPNSLVNNGSVGGTGNPRTCIKGLCTYRGVGAWRHKYIIYLQAVSTLRC